MRDYKDTQKGLDEHFGSILGEDTTSSSTDAYYGYPLGTSVRCGKSWRKSEPFVFVGETKKNGEVCPVLMKRKAVKNGLDINAKLHVADPDTDIKWVSDNTPPRAFTKRLSNYVESLKGDDGEVTAHYSYPSGQRIDEPFNPASPESVTKVDPGDLVSIRGDDYLYCGKYNGKWIMASESEDNHGATISKEDVDQKEYAVDIVTPEEVTVKRDRWKPEVARKIHKKTADNPRFGQPVRVKYGDYDEDTSARWIGNFDSASSVVAVRSGDRYDPEDRMDVRRVLNHPDDGEQFEVIKTDDDRVRQEQDLPEPEDVQYFRKMVRIPPNKRDEYAGQFKKAYLKRK